MRTASRTVSVIIPTIGRTTMSQCIEALERQTCRPDEIIIVRDTDRRGIGFARNEGIARSTGDLLAFTDDDCVPPDNWLEDLLALLERFDADVVGGTMRESDPLLHAVRMRNPLPLTAQVDTEGMVGNGANIIYKRSILEDCLRHDGYVHWLGVGEDINLIGRLRKRGAKIVYTPNTVLHLRTMTPVAYWRRQFTRGISIANLHRFYRQTIPDFTVQPSLLWEKTTDGLDANWWKILWLKVIGPFDAGSFPTFKDFLVFWFGEKVQGFGFLRGMLGWRQEE